MQNQRGYDMNRDCALVGKNYTLTTILPRKPNRCGPGKVAF